MATVNWCIHKINTFQGENSFNTLIDVSPVRVLPTIFNDTTRQYAVDNMDASYNKCPAFLDYLKNVYAINAPFDIEIQLEDGRITDVITPSITSAVVVQFRSAPNPDTNTLISLQFNYVFYSDESVMVEQLPPFMDYTLMQQGVTVIPGTFDISKWVRPVEGAYEIRKGTRNVVIKAGTPLTYLRFVPKNSSDVKLKMVEETQQHKDVVAACLSYKTVRKNAPLAKCYAAAHNLVSKFVRPKRCPFKFGKK